MNIPNLKHIRPNIREKSTNHIEKTPKFLYNYGDPFFIDERKIEEEISKETEESFFKSFLNLFKK